MENVFNIMQHDLSSLPENSISLTGTSFIACYKSRTILLSINLLIIYIKITHVQQRDQWRGNMRDLQGFPFLDCSASLHFLFEFHILTHLGFIFSGISDKPQPWLICFIFDIFFLSSKKNNQYYTIAHQSHCASK